MSETKERELRECPFCGIRCISHNHGKFYSVYCRVHGCAGYGGVTRDTEEEAIAAWNRRAAPAAEWTKEPPTEHGYYLVEYGAGIIPVVVSYAIAKKKEDRLVVEMIGFGCCSVWEFCEDQPDAIWFKVDHPPLQANLRGKEASK